MNGTVSIEKEQMSGQLRQEFGNPFVCILVKKDSVYTKRFRSDWYLNCLFTFDVKISGRREW